MIFTKLKIIVLTVVLSTSSFLASAALITFQNGYLPGDYAGTHDTELRSDNPTTNYGNNVNISIDADDGSDTAPIQALLRFADIFGAGVEQIVLGSTINSAILSFQIHSPGDDLTMLQMLTNWDESSATWDSLGNGIQNDNIEASFLRTLFNLDSGSVTDEVTLYQIDVTAEVQLWADGTANYGWGFIPTGSDGVDFHASEHSNDGHARPQLLVNFNAPKLVDIPEPKSVFLMSIALLGILLRKTHS